MGKVNSMQMGEINLGSYKFWGNGVWTEENSGSYTPSAYAYVAQDAVFGFGFWDVDQVTDAPQALQAFTGTISTPVQAAYDKGESKYASDITFAIFNTGASGEASIETSIDLSKSANNVFAVGMFKEGTTPYFTEYDKESAFANVVVKAGASVKVGLNGYIWVGSAQDSTYESDGQYQSQRFTLTVDGGEVAVDGLDGVLKVTNTGAMTIKNGGSVYAPMVLNRNVITVDGAGSVLSAVNATVYSESNAANAAALKVTNGAMLSIGKNLQLGHASAATRKGEMIIDDASATIADTLFVNANGSVVMNGASYLQVGDIDAAAGQNWLSITINADDAKAIVDATAAGEYAYLVNQTGTGAFDTDWVTINGEAYANGMEVAPGYYLAISDNDLVITDEYIDVLYVDKDYSEGNAGGHIFGYNAFTTVDSAFTSSNYQGMLTIMLMDDSVESSASTWFGGYIIKNGSGKDSVTLTIDYTIGAAGPGIKPDDVTAGTSMTIEKGVVVNSTADLYAYNGKAVVNGVANVNGIYLMNEGSFYGSKAPAVLEVNGKVTADSLYAGSGELYVNNAVLSVAGGAVFEKYGAGDSYAEFKGAKVKFKGGLDLTAATMVARKTDMDVTGTVAIADKAALLIEEGTEAEVAGDIANKGSIKVSNATLSAKNVVNAGDITAANAKITFASLAGNGSFNVETTVVTVEGNVNSAIKASAKSDVTVKGDFTGNAEVSDSTFKVAGAFTGDAAVAGSTFAAGKDFTGNADIVKSVFTVANNFNGNATVKDSTFAVTAAKGSVSLAGDIVITGDFCSADIAIASKVNMSVLAGGSYKDDELFSAAEVAYGAGEFKITTVKDKDFGGTITIDVAADSDMKISKLYMAGTNSFAADEDVVTVYDMILSDLTLSRYESVIGYGFADIKNITFGGIAYTLGVRDADTGIQFTLEDGELTADKLLEVFDVKDGGSKVLKLDGADYYGSNLEAGTGVKNMNISNVTVSGHGQDVAATRVFGGSKIVDGYYAAGLDITSVTVTNSGIEYQVYGGSNVQGGTYAGTVNTAVTIDGDFNFGTVVGGSRVEGARMNVIGDSSVSINGGSYKLVVGASVIGKDGDASMMGNSDVTISGNATVNGSVYGGGFVQSTGKYQQIGSTNVTIADSTVTKNIYGGHAGASTSTFDATLVGSTYVTIVDSTIGGNVFGGSYNLGSITGSTNITISGNSNVAGFINGDSSNAIYYGVDSCVNGLRNLTFDGFTAAAFNATEIVNIDNIAFVNNSDVNFANADIFDGAEILDWTFEDGSSFAGAGVLDFEGSTLHVKEVFDADLEDWTLVAAGEIKNFDKLEGAFAVNGTNQAMTWNGVDAYELSYAGTDYKLFQEGNSIKFTATLA